MFNEETDLNGEIILMELPAGRYTYTETQAAEGFTINTGSFEFVVDYYGHVTGTTEITDEPICLQIDKVDLFTGEPFPLVEFQLRNMDDQVIRTILVDQIREVGGLRSVVVSNNNDYRIWAKDGEDFFHVGDDGHVEFRYLPAGEYKLVEVPPTGYIAEDEISVVLTDRNGVSNPKMVRVENRPTGVKIKKIDAGSGNPLMGAGFEIKVKSDNGFETLTFVKNSDGSYFYDTQGNVTELMVDGMGEITLYGMPLGDIWVEETTVPDGYFPISAQKLTITKEMSDAAPYEMTIKNNKFVKLGMNSDWWEFPALCGGVLLLLAGGVVAIIYLRKKRGCAA